MIKRKYWLKGARAARISYHAPNEPTPQTPHIPPTMRHTFRVFGEPATVQVNLDSAVYQLLRWQSQSKTPLDEFLDAFGDCYADETEKTLREVLAPSN
jgi:hypothetical protein